MNRPKNANSESGISNPELCISSLGFEMPDPEFKSRSFRLGRRPARRGRASRASANRL